MSDTIGPEEILQLAQGFMECKILHTAAELNIFSLLAEKPLNAEEAALRIGADAHALSMLLDALASIGLLVKQGETYRCGGVPAQFLADNSARSVLPMVLHMASLWSRWSRLTDVVRGIGGAKEEFNFARRDEELRAFIGAMHVVATPLAKQIVESVNAQSSRALIDVGGGSGTYTIAFLRAVPDMKATIFDLPEVIEMARERIAEEGLLDRVAFAAGSFHQQELPPGHDLALVSAIIHSNSPDQNQDLYSRVFRSLNGGGRILIRDYVMESGRTFPRDGAIFAINMLVGTSGGRNYTFDEIKADLLKAGFAGVNLLRQGEHMDAVVEAFKP
jgi:predicted O-methyltransferase YrrM